MKKRIYILFSIVIALLIVAVSILFAKNQSFNNRIHTVSKNIERMVGNDSTFVKQEAYKTQFKEDYYIQQQSNDTALILTVFGITIAVFSYLSYNSFLSQIKDIITKIEEIKSEHKKNIEAHEKKLIKLSNEMNLQLALNLIDDADDSLKSGNIPQYCLSEITGCAYLLTFLKSTPKTNENQLEIKSINDLLYHNLQKLYEKVENESVVNISKNNMSYYLLKERQTIILENISEDYYQKINTVFGKLKLVD